MYLVWVYICHIYEYVADVLHTRTAVRILKLHMCMSVMNFTHMHTIWLIVLGFNDTSTLVGHFVSSPREREKKGIRDSRGDEREDSRMKGKKQKK